MSDANNLNATALDRLAEDYLERQKKFEKAANELQFSRDMLVRLIQNYGVTPARAIKAKGLNGREYELRVYSPVEVTVDTRRALALKTACKNCRGLFKKLFRRVEQFVLVEGADRLLNQPRLPEGAPQRLRAMFAKAVRIRELSPQLEIRKRSKSEEAA